MPNYVKKKKKGTYPQKAGEVIMNFQNLSTWWILRNQMEFTLQKEK